ncbi:M56 family metallopeptidase [Clostridium aminobutyricum]|uniref:Peptidase M56 domain-containing protein n=1 Tax=Clostridium aminobutyricum TaxID=33953 RepID=A0A939D763_CLOAM|nr:M56 family metallopeptidase [Clostridium aminobutyricum]MBN7772325.1 hypothetical protein [Clostridium aminobutyricum]
MINTILSSSVLILIILAIRFVFKGKINPMVQYGLWGLVVLRLAIFNLLNIHPIESTLSVMNAAGNVTKTIQGTSTAEQVIAGNAQVGTHNTAIDIMNNVKTGIMISGDGISAAAAIDWQLVIMIVWAIGTITLGLWLLIVNLKFSKKIVEKRSFLLSVETDHQGKSLPVYVADGLYSPCLMGHRGEIAIYVTSKVAADKEKLRYAIEHELCHYKHHDLEWSILRGLLLVFYWFNPLVWVAAIMSKRDCELACDYGVIKEMSKEDRLTYGKTLVDLINQREKKNNVLQIATTMYGSSNGIKERVTMIAKNKKMKVTTLIAALLIVSLSVGCTFTTAPKHEKDSSPDQQTEITAFATKWADAFSQRDAKTIYDLCENETLYLTIGSVGESGDLWMGISSPWPWNKDYKIEIVDSSTIDIYYYFRTSSPTVYAAKETVTIKKIDGAYKAVGDSWKHFDKVKSKAEFDEAYKLGFPDFTEFAATYQFQADENADYNQGRKEILENPATAAIDQLNLDGAKVSDVTYQPVYKKAVVTFAWQDGEVTVNLIQPTFKDENGTERQATIWIVVNEEQAN